jgi:hypothetical protein
MWGVSRYCKTESVVDGANEGGIRPLEPREFQALYEWLQGRSDGRVRMRSSHGNFIKMIARGRGHVNIDMSRIQAHLLASARCVSAANARLSACGFD